MKTIVYKVLAALAVATILAGCAGAKPESAMQWMQRQPMLIDP